MYHESDRCRKPSHVSPFLHSTRNGLDSVLSPRRPATFAPYSSSSASFAASSSSSSSSSSYRPHLHRPVVSTPHPRSSFATGVSPSFRRGVDARAPGGGEGGGVVHVQPAIPGNSTSSSEVIGVPLTTNVPPSSASSSSSTTHSSSHSNGGPFPHRQQQQQQERRRPAILGRPPIRDNDSNNKFLREAAAAAVSASGGPTPAKVPKLIRDHSLSSSKGRLSTPRPWSSSSSSSSSTGSRNDIIIKSEQPLLPPPPPQPPSSRWSSGTPSTKLRLFSAKPPPPRFSPLLPSPPPSTPKLSASSSAGHEAASATPLASSPSPSAAASPSDIKNHPAAAASCHPRLKLTLFEKKEEKNPEIVKEEVEEEEEEEEEDDVEEEGDDKKSQAEKKPSVESASSKSRDDDVDDGGVEDVIELLSDDDDDGEKAAPPPPSPNPPTSSTSYFKNFLKAAFASAKPNSSSASPTSSTAATTSSSSDSTLLVYPSSGRSRISVTHQDLSSLDPGKELNDTIIDFYMRYIVEEIVDDKQRSRVHVFSTYFYKRLTDKSLAVGEERRGLTSDQRRHARVSKWTKDVDLFDKDFIFVPVNYKGEHWFLIVICYPMLALNKYDSDRPAGSVLRTARMVQRPCVLVFDSVAGGNAVAEFTSGVIVGYLQEEYSAKKSSTTTKPTGPRSAHQQPVKQQQQQQPSPPPPPAPDFRQRLKRISPTVPLQDGDVDCGLFLLQFAESFFTNPIPDYGDSFLRAKEDEEGLSNWFSQQIIDEKRGQIKELILKLAADK